MLVVGEASGDLHGAGLVRALLRRAPDIEVFGAGGERLARAGMRVILDIGRLAGMGFTELAGSLKRLWRSYRLLRAALRDERPNLLILVDFPEFNLRLAAAAKKRRVPVLYYISPQVWAWRKGRVRQIARRVDRLAVVFPFEANLYEEAGVKATFVGHPLLDVVRPADSRAAMLTRHGLGPERETIVLLPGSRPREVSSHLPVMLKAAERLARDRAVQFIVVRATTVPHDVLTKALAGFSAKVAIAADAYSAIDAGDLVWTASGTATLETALLRKPMVVVYKLSWLTYGLARLLVRVNHIGMVNIVAGERVVPELIQSEFTAERLVGETVKILRDEGLRREIVSKLEKVRERLGAPGAADRVAEIALETMAG
jgi:lipid-A-disaccharide synthase